MGKARLRRGKNGKGPGSGHAKQRWKRSGRHTDKRGNPAKQTTDQSRAAGTKPDGGVKTTEKAGRDEEAETP